MQTKPKNIKNLNGFSKEKSKMRMPKPFIEMENVIIGIDSCGLPPDYRIQKIVINAVFV